MKKLITLALTIVMVFSLAACGAGGEGGDAASPISVISREDGSGTRSAFVELMGVMVDDVDNTTVNAEISQSTSVVVTTVAGNENAIGYISMGAMSDEVKAVKVDGVEATTDNVKAGNYAVSRPFVVATNDQLTELAADFIDYIMSADGQAIIAEEGYITIDDAAAAYEVKDGLEGKIVLAGSTSVAPVMQVIADSYKALYEGVEIEIQQTGSGAGITSTIEKACDIGMSSRALKDEEVAQGLTETTIAMDGIAVIVNNNNAIEDLTSEQIRQIFTGEVTDWAALQ
ncbi:MAG: substrate-binding domain-containing protein [Firmicutes bacterium]|nr:substrate-binding domain-containing protein [Bacillota bacterium]